MVEAAAEVVPEKKPPLAEVVEDKPVVVHHAATSKTVTEIPESIPKQTSKGSLDRDIALAKVDDDKRLSFIKAWEDSEKTKAQNKAEKKLSEVNSWENSKRAALEGKLKTFDEELEKKKAGYAEKVKNKLAIIHKQAEEQRAEVLAKRGEEQLKADEAAAKFRAAGQIPPTGCGCLGA